MSSSLLEEGAAAAFERLYRRHRGDVYRFVLRDVRNPEEAEDVTQTAFLNAFRALQHGDAPEKPRAWLLTIAQNVARRRFRARAVRPQEVELDPELVAAAPQEGPSAAEIREALRHLRPNHRAAIVLREIGGLSYTEIGDTLGLSVSAVETLLFRARRALREELAAGEEHRLRVGGIVLPLPAAFHDWLGSLAGWFGRRVAVAKVAGAVGATVIGAGVAVQTGALALPDAGASDEPSPATRGLGQAQGVSARQDRQHEAAKRRAAPATGAQKATRAGQRRGGGDQPLLDANVGGISLPQVDLSDVGGVAVPTVELPALPDLQVQVPGVQVPEVQVPDLQVPDVQVPDVQAPDVQVPEVQIPGLQLPNVALPVPVPEVQVQLPQVQPASLPDAGDLLP
jgi:RNA polymerase sigma-70 factor, ECF subfamily